MFNLFLKLNTVPARSGITAVCTARSLKFSLCTVIRTLTWVKDTVRENAKVVDGVMVWEDTIPKVHGKYFRDHCDQLNWSVRKAGLTVEFKGLTFGVVADGTADAVRRRRLLGRDQNGGC